MDLEKMEKDFCPSPDGKAAVAQNGMVSTAFPRATRAGMLILEKGGNAVDAACACSLALGVCEPQASGLGGQTLMMVYTGKKMLAIDGSSRAPSLAHVNALYGTDKANGYRATTVPSTLATLFYTQEKYGKLSWKAVVEPAIAIAEDGYAITDLQHRLLVREAENFHKVESKSGVRYFYRGGVPYEPGDNFRQPDLARLLEVIGQNGVKEFYTGKTAKQIDGDMRENGGLLRYDDLALIPWPIERPPLKCRFRGLDVYAMPPPGSGRTLLFILSMIHALPPKRLYKNEKTRIHLFVEMFRQAFLDRSDRPFDPNFYPQVAGENLTSGRYAMKRIKEITRRMAPFIPVMETSDELSGETTHLSVMDRYGMAVSLTQSIERVYGSKAAAEGLGFLYNNYLMDFEYKLPEHPYYLRPNATPWSSVAPSLVFRKKDLYMALGSPGSERSLSAMTQFLTHMIDECIPMDKAMEMPRVHCSLGGQVSVEGGRIDPELISFLREEGFRINERRPYSFYMGAIHAVLKKRDGSGFQGVAEIRRDGIAGGV